MNGPRFFKNPLLLTYVKEKKDSSNVFAKNADQTKFYDAWHNQFLTQSLEIQSRLYIHGSKPLQLSANQLGKNYYFQELLFLKANTCLLDMEALFSLLSPALYSKTKTLLKGKTPETLMEAIRLKFFRKGYSYVGEMRDIARGRIDIDSHEQMNKVIQEIMSLCKIFGFRIQEQCAQRHPILDENGVEIPDMYSYSRIHLIINVRDQIFECQVGLSGVSTFFETKGILIPPEITLKPSTKNDLHDIGYKLFRYILHKAKKCPEHASILKAINIQEFMDRMSKAVAEVDFYGKKDDEVREILKTLHKDAGILLFKIIQVLKQKKDHPLRQTLAYVGLNLNEEVYEETYAVQNRRRV